MENKKYRSVNVPVRVHALVKKISDFTGVPIAAIVEKGSIHQAGVIADMHSMPVELRDGGAELRRCDQVGETGERKRRQGTAGD